MKHQIIPTILILGLLLISFATVGLSQAANANPPATQNAEPMGENDHLAFMPSSESPESPEPSSGGLLVKTIGAMLLVVGLIFAGAWAAKKMGFGGPKGSGGPDELGLTILSSVSLGNGRTISTVQFGERVLLVGLTSQSFTLLAEENTAREPVLRNSRSVSEMLAEENDPFGVEFDNAQSRIGLWNDGKGAA